MANTTFTPSWKSAEKDLHSNDLKTQKKAEIFFDEDRKNELKTNPQAKRWEESRKKAWAKDKHEYTTKRKKEEVAPILKMRQELKQAGSFNTGIKPMPGFVLIKVDKPEEKTASGILLPDTADDIIQRNTGTVIAIGEKMITLAEVVQPPVQPGDRVLFKKGLPGLEVIIKDELMLLMTWQDLLAKMEEE